VSGTLRLWPAIDITPIPDLFEAALTDYAPTAIEERASDAWRVYFATPESRDEAATRLRRDFPATTIAPVDVPDENWAARSQASLHAIRAGRIVVAPPWDIPSRGQAGDIVIVIQPSMGFGTGHHATTRLCLSALQQLDLRDRAVVDVGTGSGVLAIAASLLGATSVTGFDDDPDAITAAQENLDLNPEARVTLAVGDLRSVDLPASDVVVANLTGGLLQAAALSIRHLAADDGRLVLSGLMASEEPDVMAAFADWSLERRSQEEEWLCLTLRRPSR
jgi:ribosomal protein L11 methyltransferase